MNRRERFALTMNHQEADRLPLDQGKQVSSIHRNIYNPIRREFGLPDAEIRILDRMSQCVHTDEDLLQLWDIDFRWLIPAWTNVQEIDENRYRNTFGVQFKYSGDYYAIDDPGPLREGGMDELATYPWPATDDPRQFAGLREKAEWLFSHTDYVVGADGIKGGIFQTALELDGYDQFYMDLILNPEFAHALLDKVTEIYKAMYTRYLQEVGEFIQAIYLTDDLGTQNSLLMSPDMWRQFIMPREKALIQHIKSYAPHVKVIYHTDGCVRTLLHDLVDEQGIDVLNPVQTSVDELADTASLKEEFGHKVCFHGAIDVQKVLNLMTPEEIRREVNRRMCDLGRDGGYIICPCHNIGHDVPPVNIKAMYDAIHEFNRFPLQRI